MIAKHLGDYAFFLARIFFVVLGCGAVAWGAVEFPIFWQESLPDRIANRIIAGEQFKFEPLAKQLSVAERIDKSAYCRPSVTRSAAIIRLRLLEQRSPESSSALSDAQDLQASIKKSLACAPSNPFFWTVLYWLSSQTSSPVPPDYLRLSYKLGPNEGWIALRRNRLAFTLFEKLPKDLQKSAIAEFVRLLNNDFEPNGGLYAAVLDILVGPAWQVRDQITPYLMNLPRRNRESLVRDLSAKGFDLALPGVKQPEQTR